MKKILTLAGLFIFILTIPTFPIFAQTQQIHLGTSQFYGIKAIDNPNASVGNIVSNAMMILFIAGGLAVLVFILWGAFEWITSGGDKEKIAGARRKIVNALIGFALLALAAFIVSLFGQIVGYNPLSPTSPPLPRLDQAPATKTP